MKKKVILSLVLSLLLISLNVGAAQMPSEPKDRFLEHTGNLSCNTPDTVLFVRIFPPDEQGISSSFWYVKEAKGPVIVIFDIAGEVTGVFLKPKHQEVIYYSTVEEARAGPHPSPCAVWESYINKTI